MSRFKKGIIVSNILDPLSKDPKDLKEVYQRSLKSAMKLLKQGF